MGDTPPPADGGLDIIDFADGGGQEQQQGSGDAQLDVIDFGDDGGQQEQGLQVGRCAHTHNRIQP